MSVSTLELAVKRMMRFDGEGSLKAFVDVAIGDSFIVKGFRVVDGKNGLFVSMPRQQGKNGKWFDTVSPISDTAKHEIGRVVLEAYQQEDGSPKGE